MQFSKSSALFDRAKKSIPGGVNSPVRAFRSVGMNPLFINKAEGSKMYDVDGNKYIDYICSWGPMILGHGHPKVKAALAEALEGGVSYGAPTEREIELAELVISAYPAVEMIRMVNSGTEACMSAIRLARAHTGRDKIIKFAGNYHGHADYLLVKAGSGAATMALPDSPGVPESFTQHTLIAEFNNAEQVSDLFEEYPNEIACIIVEPFAGNMGFVQPNGNFLRRLREICDREGAVLIFDEVMTGFRVHPGGAATLLGIMPDLTCFGKVIGGGLPVGAYGGQKEIMERVAPSGSVYQAGTLSGNPLAMAAGISTLTEVLSPGFFDDIARKTTLLVDGLKTAAMQANVPITAGSAGSMFGFYFLPDDVKNYGQALKADREHFAAFFKAMLSRGVYFAPSAFEAGFMSSAHDEEDINKTVSAFAEALAEVGPPKL